TVAIEPVLPTYKTEDKVATRKAYGDALVALAAIPEVVAMDGEVSNSTHADEFAKAHPDRFFDMWISEQQLVAAAVGLTVRADTPGIGFMRTTRGADPTLYGAGETFKVGGAKVLRHSPKDKVALIGAGVTLHSCLAAADALAAKKIPTRVIDLYSVKPVDAKTLREAARVTKGR